MGRYVKDTPRLVVKIVKESTSDIIFEVGTTALEIHDWFKIDYVHSVMRNTFGEEKMKAIGTIIVIIDQTYVYKP